MNAGTQHDVGALIVVAAETGADVVSLTTSTDNSATAGASIDRLVAGRNPALSCKLIIPYTAALGQGETLTITAKLQESLTGGTAFSTAGTIAAIRARHICGKTNTGGGTAGTVTTLTLNSSGELAATVVATGGTSGTTEVGVVELDCDIATAGQYIRAYYTPTLSASSADTVKLAPIVILGGSNVEPVV